MIISTILQILAVKFFAVMITSNTWRGNYHLKRWF